MTYSLVNAGTVVGGTLTIQCTSTTAHNLLVLSVSGESVGTPVLTPPAGWLAVPGSPAGATGQAISWMWHYPDCPASITSVIIGLGGAGFNFVAGQILEFHDSAGTSTTPADAAGAKVTAASATSPQAVATSGAAAAHNLAVCVANGYSVSSIKDTMTPGAGFTQAGNYGNAVKQSLHVGIDYMADTGASAGTVTDSVTFTATASSFAGLIATFKTATAGPPPGPPPRVVESQAPLAISGVSPASRPSFA